MEREKKKKKKKKGDHHHHHHYLVYSHGSRVQTTADSSGEGVRIFRRAHGKNDVEILVSHAIREGIRCGNAFLTNAEIAASSLKCGDGRNQQETFEEGRDGRYNVLRNEVADVIAYNILRLTHVPYTKW